MQKDAARIQNRLNVFSGPDAVKDFLNPDCNPPLPLVEIPQHLNSCAKDGVRIFAKLMNFLPLANVKSLPAYNMLLEREKAGGLSGVRSLIENSSGNTVFSLAVIGRLFGIPKTKAIVSHEVTWGKLQMLRFFGTEIIVNEEPICPDPSDKESGIYKAKQMGKKKGWFNPGQYDNKANPRAHEQWTGPQIWEQTEGKITVFCAGLGTTGTMVGTGGYLKKKSPTITRVGVARLPNNPVPGVRTPNLLREIAFDWQRATDRIEEVGTKESFEKSLELCRAGIIAGPSSGFALQGLLQFISKQKALGKLEDIRNDDGDIIAVFICPDGPFPYIDEYFEYLDASHFSGIEHEELLINKHGETKPNKQNFEVVPATFDIEPSDAYAMAYPISPKEAWAHLKESGNVALRDNVSIVDVRPYNEYIHFHLPGSERMDSHDITENLSKLSKKWQGRKVLLMCPMGIRTRIVAEFLRKKGVEAYSIKGGASEWSALNLPRWRPNICNIQDKEKFGAANST
jgi:cysteine synthase/rhodanese-related sulfurtransferase